MKKIIFLHKESKVKKSKLAQENEKTTFDKFLDGELRSNDLDGVKFLNQKNEEEIEFLSLMQKVIDRQQFISLVKEMDDSPVYPLVGTKTSLLAKIHLRSCIAAFLVVFAVAAILLSSLVEHNRRPKYQRLSIINPPIEKWQRDYHAFLRTNIVLLPTEKNKDLLRTKNRTIGNKKYIGNTSSTANKLASGNSELISPIASLKHVGNKNNFSIKTKEVKEEIHNISGNHSIQTNHNSSRSNKNLNLFNLALKKIKSKHVNIGATASIAERIGPQLIIEDHNTAEFNLYKNNINYRKAVGYVALKDYKRAEEAYLKAIEAQPANITLYHEVASFYENIGKFGKLEKTLTALLKVDPSNVDVYRKRAFVCTITRKYNRAEKDYTKLIQLEPKNEDNYQRRGALHKRRKYYQKAERDYTAIINIDPNNQKTFRSRGLFYKTTNQPDRAALDMVKYYSFLGLTRNFTNQLGYIED